MRRRSWISSGAALWESVKGAVEAENEVWRGARGRDGVNGRNGVGMDGGGRGF